MFIDLVPEVSTNFVYCNKYSYNYNTQEYLDDKYLMLESYGHFKREINSIDLAFVSVDLELHLEMENCL